MPGPPPPPPPGGPPPPMPAFTPVKAAKGGSDNRSALLSDIRKLPKLNKVNKALIKDRSDPLASVNKSAATNGSSGGGGITSPPNGLGSLFPAGGIPKLKSRGGISSNNGTSSSSSSSNSRSPETPTIGGIQEELRKRLNNDGRNANRGPAPPAPTRNSITKDTSSLPLKNGFQYQNNGLNNKTLTTSLIGHRKTQSNGNLNTIESSVPTSRNNNNNTKSNFGKPNVAPKPPILHDKPASAGNLANGKIRKCQSVRLPHSPLAHTAQDNNNPLGLIPAAGSVMDRSRTLGGSTGQLALLKSRSNGRPTVPPPSVPTQPPPPPPSVKVKPPNHAPPPPPCALPQAPTHAPPPPPHRTLNSTGPPVPSRAPPAVPAAAAPAPPPRNSSIRPGSATSLENRFQFHSVSEFPQPMPFRGVPKVYTSRQAGGKQPAPPPPSHINLANNRLCESSSC